MKTKVYSAFPLYWYIQRYKDRGNNDAFVELLTKNWDNWMEEMDNQEGCYKVKLDSGQYLTDVID
jgi:hypothetical protein